MSAFSPTESSCSLTILRSYRFWALAIKTASPTSQKHMVESFTDYLESVVQQAEDRDDDRYRTIDEYLHNRRQNIGARPSFAPMELDLDLTDEVFYHPVVQELSVYITDLIILDNVCYFCHASQSHISRI